MDEQKIKELIESVIEYVNAKVFDNADSKSEVIDLITSELIELIEKYEQIELDEETQRIIRNIVDENYRRYQEDIGFEPDDSEEYIGFEPDDSEEYIGFEPDDSEEDIGFEPDD